MQLDWTSADDIVAVKAASPAGDGFELVLGADVCYGQQALPALFSCAAALLARTSTAVFLLGERSCSLDSTSEWPLSAVQSTCQQADAYLQHDSTAFPNTWRMDFLAAGYVSRAKLIDRLLMVEAERAGLSVQELPGTRTLMDGSLEGVIYHMHWP